MYAYMITDYRSKTKRLLSWFAFGFALLPQLVSAAGLQSNASSWLSVLGTVPSDSPKVQRVQSIFQNLKRTTRGANLRAKLFIVDSDNEPWAVALQDGNIILSAGAIDVAYDDSDLVTSDARIAFILGHELAHIIANDFWHQQVYMAFYETGTGLINSDASTQRRKEQELRADEEGLLYASLAGYDTRKLFSDQSGNEDFLIHWAKQTDSITGAHYHTPQERTRFLRERLAALHESVSFFKYGVKLAHFGRYQDAQILLDEFYRDYPSKQVLSNLGFIYIQTARQKMPVELAYRFWYPTLLDYDSGVLKLTRSLDTRLPESAKQDLETAEQLLEAAIALDNTDLVARINLVATHLYLGKFHAAQANIAEAMLGRESNTQLLALRALVLMHSTEADHWNTTARKTLAELASKENADDNIVFNYARLLSERGRLGMAKQYWNALAPRLNALPNQYQHIICREIPEHKLCAKAAEERVIKNLVWDTEINHGDDIDEPAVRKILEQWGQPLSRKLGSLDTTIYTHPNGNSAMAIDGIIELVSLVKHPFPLASHLRKTLGEPWVNLPMGNDNIWSYGSGLSVLVRDEKIVEVWLGK